MNTTEKATFHYVTFIRASAEAVFDAITRPESAARYWGHENVSDWQVGSDWAHVRANDARTVELRGKVLETDPPHRLVISWANASQAGNPQETSRVTFVLEPYDGMVKLSVTHDDLIPGSGMHTGISKGWPIVLSSLKSWLETGQPMDVFARPAG